MVYLTYKRVTLNPIQTTVQTLTKRSENQNIKIHTK